eukprot:GFUD01019943.1.p1 GENE.GFUD01019943.1~~GFUD01019943.1.p1  ORF type:complete len:409 (-),score=80.84 GFUD01019943.1:831-2057(-)
MMDGRESTSRSILQKVGSVPLISPRDSESEAEDNCDQEVGAINTQKSIMNMKQEGPFLVPQLWKDSISLENITNDFLESNVTGEVMNLDDFLKELQVNELAQQTEDLQRHVQTPTHQSHNAQHSPPNRMAHMQHEDNRFHPLIRPANIETLKEQSHPVRPSIMHHVGKPPELHMMQSTSHMDHMGDPPTSLSLPHREAMQNTLSPKDHPGQGIPQASVRPLVRPVIMSTGKHEHSDLSRLEDSKPPSSKRMRRMSEGSAFSDDDDDDDEGHHNFGGFTSTVCVNFSQDDLRLATIPGQEGDFDPATRRFSEEELKPQPIIRKRKKQFVPDELKNNKYWAKRCKNNEAAKRSREARRLKENQIAMRARFLEEENTALKGEVEHLKKENSDLKQMMMALEEKLNQMAESR